MKKILAVLLVLAMMFTLIACTGTKTEDKDNNDDTDVTDVTDNTGDGETTEGFDYANADLSEYVKLGNYKGLEATRYSDELTDDEFIGYMNDYALSEQYKHITDRAVEEGDTVSIDYSGEMDGEKFSGGTSTDVELVAADGQGFIDGFGSGLIGHMPGESFVIDVTFPDPYENNPDMAGKPAQFAIKLHYIVDKANPITVDDLTDEYVSEEFGYETVEKFLSEEREVIAMNKKYGMQQTMNSELMSQIFEASEIIKYPEGEVDRIYNETMTEYQSMADYYGLTVDELLEYSETSVESLRSDIETSVAGDLVLLALVKELDVEPTDEEVDETIALIAAMYGASSEDLINYYGRDQFVMEARFNNAMAAVAELGTITEAEYAPEE